MYNNFSKIIISFAIIFLFSSCDLLTTRDAEEPKYGRSSNLPATTPDQLFTNLKNSFSEKIENDYADCFVNSSFSEIPYLFTPSSEASYKYNELTEWDLDDESTYFQNLVNAVGENGNIIITLELLSSSVEGNSESRNYNYTITIPFIEEATATFYEGNAFFKINLDSNNEYVITEWIDTNTGDTPSWSEMKGRFYVF